MELLGRLRRAVKKLTFLMNLKNYLSLHSTWRLASFIRARAPATIARPRWRRRAMSFNDRPGLRACEDLDAADYDDHDVNGLRSEGSSGATSPYQLRRTSSYPLEEDVDKRAEMFISNFHYHLNYERQISLDLRYCRVNSSDSSAESNNLVSPLSSASSQLVSPT